jgi:predicted DNA-binding transcriptional regulator YafY
MDRTERFYKIHQLLETRRLVSFEEMQRACEVSRATLQRDLEYMRTRLNAPILWDRELGGYRFAREAPQAGAQYELPGLWFNSQEIHALLTMQHLLANLDPGGLLAQHIEPLQSRLNTLLGTTQDPVGEIRRRVLVVGVGKRALKLAHFERVGSALLRRKRLQISYFARGNGETTEREVSPQRLVHYRENWYLDAWCHTREDLRNFAVDSILQVDVIERRAKEVARRTVESVLGPGYGIFTGSSVQIAQLRFTPQRARWVSTEQWHPQQHGEFDADGNYVLRLPYADDRELIMDILRYGADCEVLGPAKLRNAVRRELHKAAQRYGIGSG